MNFSRAPPCSPCVCKSSSLFIVSPYDLCVGTASGPGSPIGQPAWGGGCDRIIPRFSQHLVARHRASIRKYEISNDKWEITRSLPLPVLTPQPGAYRGANHSLVNFVSADDSRSADSLDQHPLDNP